MFKKKSKYLIKERLEDVIRLITVLALTEYPFPRVATLEEKFRGKPTSVKKKQSWLNIALEHPEFFRPNGDNTCVALLLRSYKPIVNHDKIKDYREPLSISETQELINKAMDLHDKAANRSQRWNFLLTALIGAAALLAANIITVRFKNADSDKNIQQIIDTLNVVNKKIH